MKVLFFRILINVMVSVNNAITFALALEYGRSASSKMMALVTILVSCAVVLTDARWLARRAGRKSPNSDFSSIEENSELPANKYSLIYICKVVISSFFASMSAFTTLVVLSKVSSAHFCSIWVLLLGGFFYHSFFHNSTLWWEKKGGKGSCYYFYNNDRAKLDALAIVASLVMIYGCNFYGASLLCFIWAGVLFVFLYDFSLKITKV